MKNINFIQKIYTKIIYDRMTHAILKESVRVLFYSSIIILWLSGAYIAKGSLSFLALIVPPLGWKFSIEHMLTYI